MSELPPEDNHFLRRLLLSFVATVILLSLLYGLYNYVWANSLQNVFSIITAVLLVIYIFLSFWGLFKGSK